MKQTYFKFIFLLFIPVILFFVNCSSQKSESPKLTDDINNTDSQNISFSTGFELGTGPGQVQSSLSAVGDLVLNFNMPKFFPGVWNGDQVQMPLYFEGGSPNDRFADIAVDPVNPANKVLHYWMKNATIDDYLTHKKGRIQNCFPFKDIGAQVTEHYSKQKIFFTLDWNKFFLGTPIDSWWLAATIQEFWMGGDWEGHPSPSRIELAIAPVGGIYRIGAVFSKKDPGETELVEYWRSVPVYQVPLGEWLTIETFFKTGNASNGRFKITVKKDSEVNPTTIIDVTNFTYAPGVVEAVPLTHWCAQKLYSSDNILHTIRDNGGVAQVYFDDFQFTNKWPNP